MCLARAVSENPRIYDFRFSSEQCTIDDYSKLSSKTDAFAWHDNRPLWKLILYPRNWIACEYPQASMMMNLEYKYD